MRNPKHHAGCRTLVVDSTRIRWHIYTTSCIIHTTQTSKMYQLFSCNNYLFVIIAVNLCRIIIIQLLYCLIMVKYLQNVYYDFYFNLTMNLLRQSNHCYRETGMREMVYVVHLHFSLDKRDIRRDVSDKVLECSPAIRHINIINNIISMSKK